jgi:DNA-directed RNA polymerase specialized sigma24 family protein
MKQRTFVREPAPEIDAAPRYTEDLSLAREILAGSNDAWHVFVQRYSPLIMAVIRRYVWGHRSDEARCLHADVLASLYHRGLSHYSGRAALSTWLVAVTRAAVVDDVRRRLGGRRLQRVLKRLGPYEREVFRLYYLEGLSFGAVLRMVRDHGAQATPDRLLLALGFIEDRVPDGLARRLRYDLHAQSVGAASSRILEYLNHLRTEAEGNEGVRSPEYRLIEDEARRLVDEVQALVARLPEDERRLLTMRFEQGWTAKRIAEELGFCEQRSVYTRIDRIVRGLRRLLEARRA